MTVEHLVHGFLSVPVAIVGTAGTVLALTLDPTIVAAAIVTVLLALTTFIMTVLTKVSADRKEAREDAATLTLELARIGRSVDGAATASVAKITALEDKVAGLIAQLAEKRQDAAVAVATASAPVASPILSAHTAAQSLKQIDHNTAETESNTARTDATVRDLKDAQ